MMHVSILIEMEVISKILNHGFGDCYCLEIITAFKNCSSIRESYYWSFEIFERPMVIDSLNLNLSRISCQIVDFNGFVDFRI